MTKANATVTDKLREAAMAARPQQKDHYTISLVVGETGIYITRIDPPDESYGSVKKYYVLVSWVELEGALSNPLVLQINKLRAREGT